VLQLNTSINKSLWKTPSIVTDPIVEEQKLSPG
jgi:hypothetical protein